MVLPGTRGSGGEGPLRAEDGRKLPPRPALTVTGRANGTSV